MKVAILAGGFGTRISEESDTKPKPMVEIGGRPILWHIMKTYSHYGHKEFVILLGYKGHVIKEYFANYILQQSSVTVDLGTGKIEYMKNKGEDWKVTLLDTGLHTMTGGRILRAEEYLSDGDFMLTYGDGVSDIDLNKLKEFHQNHKKAVTVTAVRPEGRFGALQIGEDQTVGRFNEKPQGDGTWVNGGFFVCKPEIFQYIKEGDQTIWERSPLEKLAAENKMMAYKHTGFWKPMDALRDKKQLNEIWQSGKAPWKIWN